MDSAILVGRILLVAMFVVSGLEKFADISGTAAQIASKDLPMPQVLAIAAATAEVGGGLMIAFGWKTKLAAMGLALFTVVASYFFHNFWSLPAGPEQTNQMIHAMKNLSIIGGLIVLAFAGPGRFSLDAHSGAQTWTTRTAM